jgi:DNA-binding transcriptional MerR regulator
MRDLSIGNLARRTGTNAPTIRYYEEIGLLPRATRRAGGQRSYGDDDVRRLTFIRRCRGLGFSIEHVRTLVSLMQDSERSCLEARDLARQHLTSVRAKRIELQALERSLVGFVESCETSCAGGAGSECVVLEGLARRGSAHDEGRAGP